MRTNNDPISLIDGFVEREEERKGTVQPLELWTICEGFHGIRYFRKPGVLVDVNGNMRTWSDVRKLADASWWRPSETAAYIKNAVMVATAVISGAILMRRMKRQ